MALRIGIMGAGAIGGYFGVRLSAAGFPVVLVGRAELAGARGSLTAVDLAGREYRPSPDLEVATDPAALSGMDVCIVSVKSADTPEAARTLKGALPASCAIVSLQNGIRNPAVLAEITGRPVIAGMVTYNVRREGPGRFRKAVGAPIMMGRGEGMEEVSAAFARAGEPVQLRSDMDAVLLTKLLVNANNGLCALTGLSIAESVRSWHLRHAFSACLVEGVRAARALRRPLTRLGPLAPPLLARLLRLPDAVFNVLAGSMTKIDPAARSSTLQDIDRGKATEIDYLNGEIARLGQEAGLPTPANSFVTAQVHALERAGLPAPFMTPRQVWDGARP